MLSYMSYFVGDVQHAKERGQFEKDHSYQNFKNLWALGYPFWIDGQIQGEYAYVCIKEIVTRACEVYDKHKNVHYYLTRNMEAVWMHITKRNVFILCCYNYDIPAFLPVRLQEHIFTVRQRLVIYRRFLLRFFIT